MSRNSATTAVKFMADVSDREELYDKYEPDEIRIHSKPLYDTYDAWARRSNVHVMSMDSFKDELARLGIELKPVRIDGYQKRGILLSMADLRAKLRATPAYSDYNFQDFEE
jgi:phage/plasmid-associated DNA primase